MLGCPISTRKEEQIDETALPLKVCTAISYNLSFPQLLKSRIWALDRMLLKSPNEPKSRPWNNHIESSTPVQQTGVADGRDIQILKIRRCRCTRTL